MTSDSPSRDRKSTRLNSSHGYISYAVFCLKKKNHKHPMPPFPAAPFVSFFFFNDTATTEIYPLSLHDALPISLRALARRAHARLDLQRRLVKKQHPPAAVEAALERLTIRGLLDDQRFAEQRSEEHTSELQSRLHLVCRLLLEKKKPQTPHAALPGRSICLFFFF